MHSVWTRSNRIRSDSMRIGCPVWTCLNSLVDSRPFGSTVVLPTHDSVITHPSGAVASRSLIDSHSAVTAAAHPSIVALNKTFPFCCHFKTVLFLHVIKNDIVTVKIHKNIPL